MNGTSRFASFVLGAAIVAVPLALAAPVAGQEFTRIEGWLAPSVNYPESGSFLTLRLTGATAESELASYSALARKKGERALYDRLSDEDLGRLSIDGSLGRPIAIVQETRDEGLRRLLIVVERQLSNREIFASARSARYPYLIVDATLDADGVGYGELHPAARLEVSPDGKVTYTPFEPLPLRVLQLNAS
jgi:hypothetical protein